MVKKISKKKIIKHKKKDKESSNLVSKKKVIKGNKKEIKLEKDKKGIKFQKTINIVRLLSIIGGLFIGLFLLFISWQVYYVQADHFVDYLPEKSTSFAMELEVDKDFQKNYKQKQWLFERMIGEENLGYLTKDSLFLLLNGEYRMGYSVVSGEVIMGINPTSFEINDILNDLSLFINKEGSDLVLSFDEDKKYYLKVVDDYLFLSLSKKIINKLNKEASYETLSYYKLNNLMSKTNYFSPVNILYLSSDLIYKNMLAEKINFSKDLVFDELSSIGNSFFLVGSMDILQDSLALNLKRYELNPISIDSPPTKFVEDGYCSKDGVLSISGYDLSSKWKKIQTSLFNMSYSVLQTLSYDFISDVTKKTGFDIESELIFKIKNNYCLQLDKGDRSKYFFKFQPSALFELNKFYEKAKVVFFRYVSLAKPELRNYELLDGTKASEWVIDVNDGLKESEEFYKGVKVRSVSILGSEDTKMLLATNDGQILISNSLDMMKDNIDRNITNIKNTYISNTSIDIVKVLDNFDLVKRVFNKNDVYKFRQSMNDIKNINFKEKSYNVFEILIKL